MKRLYKIIKKNLKLLVRSKSSALIVIFGPLLIIFLVGIAFDNSNPYSVKIGTYSESYSDLSNSILDQLSSNQFKVSKFDSSDTCIESIKQGTIHACITFSKDLKIDPSEENEVNFYVDYSKINLAWMILDTVSEQLEQTEESLSKDLTTALLDKLALAQDEINKDKELLQQITTEDDDIKKEIENIYSKLDNMDMDIEKETFHIGDVKDLSEDMDELIGFMSLHTLNGLKDIGGKIRGMGLNGSSSEGKSILSIINTTQSKVMNIESKLEIRRENFTEYLDSMNDNLDEVKDRLDSAGIKKAEIFSQINKIKDNLNNNFDNIIAIQESFNNIEENIGTIEIMDPEKIVSPITTSIKPVTSERSHLNYLFPSLIVLIVMFISILLASTLVIMEKSSSAYFRNFITPTKDITFILATYFTSLILLFVQLVIILIVASIFLKSAIFSSLLNLIPLLLLIVTLFTFIGMVIGYVFSSEETATLADISIGTIFLLLSSVIIPLESMPEYFIMIAQFNPFVLAEVALRKLIIFNYSLGGVIKEIGILAAYSLILFAIILIVQKMTKKHLLSKYTKKLAPIKIKKK